ncbi:MAG: S-layer homology domain-containing protein [Phascolarctobacterium sp.]|nr:S-layer homology domain-containing protein [Candidatus Phascolarctobacterium caballi]
MKKSLVLAMAMAMGVTASAYAANPFSDVAAGHWAYDSINKLVAAGVVDGYGATFGGEKLMTRYEMAQIVAKAMAKGANVDKLAAEFADELDALGVRVSKLEKKVDNVKVTGQIRYDYSDNNGRGGRGTDHGLRSRLFVEGKVNDNWTYTGMLQNYKSFGNSSSDSTADKLELKRAYFDGRLGGLKVRAGHWNEFFINDTILDDMIDGVQASYDFKFFKVFGVASKWSGDAYGTFVRGKYKDNGNVFGQNTADKVAEIPFGYQDDARLYILGASTKYKAIDFAFNYFKTTGTWGVDGFSDYQAGFERNIYSVNADWAIDKDWGLTYRYMWTDDRVAYDMETGKGIGSKDGFFAQLNFKGADPSKAGTWGLRARYFDQPQNVWLYPTYDCTNFDAYGGYEGWGVGGSYTFAKNIFLDVDYYDTESKGKVLGHKLTDRKVYSQLWFLF